MLKFNHLNFFKKMRIRKGKTKGTRADLARLLKISKPAVKELVDKGIITLLPDKKLYLEDAIKEYQTKTNIAQRRGLDRDSKKNKGTNSLAIPSSDYQTARARREIAQATLAELDLQKAEGKLIDADAAKKAFVDVAIAVRDRLLGVPKRLAPSLVGIESEQKIINILNNEILQALSGLDKDVIIS